MIKAITLLVMAFLFLYAGFASSHYFDGFWYQKPTTILFGFVSGFHFILGVFETLETILNTKNNKGNS